MHIITPVSGKAIEELRVYDRLLISGTVYAGRDAVLPKLAALIESNNLASIGIDLEGAVIFHTAVSPAGIGPTSSNKVDIESSIPLLSKGGVKIHIGKGSLSKETAGALLEHGSIFAVTPPLTALFSANLRSQRVAAFPEEGMEALHALEVTNLPAIVAIAHGRSIYNN